MSSVTTAPTGQRRSTATATARPVRDPQRGFYATAGQGDAWPVPARLITPELRAWLAAVAPRRR